MEHSSELMTCECIRRARNEGQHMACKSPERTVLLVLSVRDLSFARCTGSRGSSRVIRTLRDGVACNRCVTLRAIVPDHSIRRSLPLSQYSCNLRIMDPFAEDLPELKKSEYTCILGIRESPCTRALTSSGSQKSSSVKISKRLTHRP